MAPAIVDKLRKPGTVILGPKTVAASIAGCTVISNGESENPRAIPGGSRAGVQPDARPRAG